MLNPPSPSPLLTISKRVFRSLLTQVCWSLTQVCIYIIMQCFCCAYLSCKCPVPAFKSASPIHPSITMENSLFENTRQLSACLNAKPPGQRDKAIRDLSDGHPRQRAMLQDIHVGLLSPSHRRRLEYHKDLILVRRQRCRFMVVMQRWRKFSKVQRRCHHHHHHQQ